MATSDHLDRETTADRRRSATTGDPELDSLITLNNTWLTNELTRPEQLHTPVAQHPPLGVALPAGPASVVVGAGGGIVQGGERGQELRREAR